MTLSGQGRSRIIDINKQPTVAGAAGQRAWPEHRGETQYKNICSCFGRCALCCIKLNSLLLFIYDDNIRLVRHFIKFILFIYLQFPNIYFVRNMNRNM